MDRIAPWPPIGDHAVIDGPHLLPLDCEAIKRERPITRYATVCERERPIDAEGITYGTGHHNVPRCGWARLDRGFAIRENAMSCLALRQP